MSEFTFIVKRKRVFSPSDYVAGVLGGDRSMLARAITLVESQRPEHQAIAEEVVAECLKRSGKSIRVGITGAPGVGKSTFIEAFGLSLIEAGRRVAVLAIDPTSEKSRGSILGDKTRMEKLAQSDQAFIRPSPSSGALGGAAPKTREAMLLCEAAGFDAIIIETVGVGQSEIAVHSMTDFFLLLMLAGAGDELQGIKRGIMEMADLIAITKADGTNVQKAKLAQQEYAQALRLFPPNPNGWSPRSLTCSALTGEGVREIRDLIFDFEKQMTENGWLARKREAQAAHWLRQTLERELLSRFYSSEAVKAKLPLLEKAVRSGEISPFRAAKELLNLLP
ncbi:MAG: methylmalonyl Co-A mutase-associated GTPase MeaB [Chloroherpetonaceae bacterium]|nr:methylmalonyl Co-A mutase-associated GTPase MeaB [Chloroherpetonaceae bacterium]MDW8436583.1 methylmalonyl Co-A mutase-associated GTPase MeaB [Chloroherpetonaceae bacterium]